MKKPCKRLKRKLGMYQNQPFIPGIFSLELFGFQFSKLLSYRKIRVTWILSFNANLMICSHEGQDKY